MSNCGKNIGPMKCSFFFCLFVLAIIFVSKLNAITTVLYHDVKYISNNSFMNCGCR